MLCTQICTHIPQLPPQIAINNTLPSKAPSAVLVETTALHSTTRYTWAKILKKSYNHQLPLVATPNNKNPILQVANPMARPQIIGIDRTLFSRELRSIVYILHLAFHKFFLQENEKSNYMHA